MTDSFTRLMNRLECGQIKVYNARIYCIEGSLLIGERKRKEMIVGVNIQFIILSKKFYVIANISALSGSQDYSQQSLVHRLFDFLCNY